MKSVINALRGRHTWASWGVVAVAFLPSLALADNCPRPPEGSAVQPPPDLYSSNGTLHVQLNYVTTVDGAGRTLFCYQTPDGLESPTLHVQPGDVVQIDLTNMLP
ncbi:MAG: hypothetical protein JOY77_05485, partial [Alphaproteobacteria bacterium]|nr:hypothetical protein [Alphaproteobacteria bacterium]